MKKATRSLEEPRRCEAVALPLLVKMCLVGGSCSEHTQGFRGNLDNILDANLGCVQRDGNEDIICGMMMEFSRQWMELRRRRRHG